MSELALSPLDGRYSKTTEPISEYCSDKALTKRRLKVMVEYFLEILNILQAKPVITNQQINDLRGLYLKFNEFYYKEIKDLERTANHDIKSIELFLKSKLDRMGLGAYREYVHFGLTSQDVNSVAESMFIKELLVQLYLPRLATLSGILRELGERYLDRPMLGRTHGQAATPTSFGKEMLVFWSRLEKQCELLKYHIKMMATKFSGATGGLNAHYIAMPNIDWGHVMDVFIKEKFGFARNKYVTQVDHYDDFANIFNAMKQVDVILLGLCQDTWKYISMGYLKYKPVAGEVGSSTMPHKINPIEFENAEGNLGMADALYNHMASKLPISRLQRDLSGSTVMRNVGVPVGHAWVAFDRIITGFSKIEVDDVKMDEDLDDNYVIVAEAIQTVLRLHRYPAPYEALKLLTRTNEKITKKEMDEFIDTLNIDNGLRERLKGITPHNYRCIVPVPV